MIDPRTLKVGDRYAVEWGESTFTWPPNLRGRTYVAVVGGVYPRTRVIRFDIMDRGGRIRATRQWVSFENVDSGAVKLARIETPEVVAP